MRKYIALIVLLLVVTVYFKNGVIIRYKWAKYLDTEERDGKTYFVLSECSWGDCKHISIPTEGILRVEKEDL